MNHSPSAPSLPVPLRVSTLPRPLSLYVHDARDRFVSQRIRDEGLWEPYETALLQAILAPGGVFVDVGANIGYFSVIAAALVGEAGAVFAFEPDPENCRLLRLNVAHNGMADIIEVVEAGLADGAARGELFLSEDNLGDHQIFAAGEARQSVPVQLLSGAGFFRDRPHQPDLIKVDTQGAEFRVMAGLMPFVRNLPRPPRLLIELTPLSLRECGASGRALVELLATLGQPLWIVDHIEHRLAPSSAGELAQWCDNVDACEGDRGFMNILVGDAP
ncbi:MAG: FkbM family methyltransferase [Halioglobus sp.]|nr:FkbM family methyltransferase [Halioglobus sp.]